MAEFIEVKKLRLAQYRWLMRILGVLYLVGAVLFYFFPSELISIINFGPRIFKLSETSSNPTDRFALTYAASGMILFCLVCLFGADSLQRRRFAIIHLVGKLGIVAGFTYLLAIGQHYFIYMLALAIEIPILILSVLTLIRLPSDASLMDGSQTASTLTRSEPSA